MVKGVHKVFSTIVKDISQELTYFGESGSEVSHFIPEPRNFAEVTKLAENIIKPWLKTTLKEIKNNINNQTFMVEDPKDGEPVIHAWSDWFTILWFLNHESLVIDEILDLLKSSFQPRFYNIFCQFGHFCKFSRFWYEMGHF